MCCDFKFQFIKLNERMFKDPAQDMGLIKSSNDAVIFSSVHDSLIRTAYNMFKGQPIFGHGPKMFRIKCKIKNMQLAYHHA